MRCWFWTPLMTFSAASLLRPILSRTSARSSAFSLLIMPLPSACECKAAIRRLLLQQNCHGEGCGTCVRPKGDVYALKSMGRLLCTEYAVFCHRQRPVCCSPHTADAALSQLLLEAAVRHAVAQACGQNGEARLLHLTAVGLLGQTAVHGVDLDGGEPQNVAQLRQPRKLAAVPLHHHCTTVRHISASLA